MNAQAAHYADKKGLYVLPECLYGKYVPCNTTLFKHYVGSTWHGSDASTLKWIFRERAPLLLLAGATSHPSALLKKLMIQVIKRYVNIVAPLR